jgi:hypothetical protein
MEETAIYECPHCGESITIFVDLSAGARQRYVEDCQVCCSPNVLSVRFDGSGEVQVTAEVES